MVVKKLPFFRNNKRTDNEKRIIRQDWKKRLTTSNIDKIKTVLEKCLLPKEIKENLYNNIKTNALTIQAELDEISNITRSIEEKERIRKEIHNKIWEIIDNCFFNLNNTEFIDKIEQSAFYYFIIFLYKFTVHFTISPS